MKSLYIWNSVSDLTDNYHNGGGVVVVAPSLERARKIIKENCYSEHPDKCGALTEPPDHVIDLSEERCFIFPDAGCC